jgi:hypothetical protein
LEELGGEYSAACTASRALAAFVRLLPPRRWQRI